MSCKAQALEKMIKLSPCRESIGKKIRLSRPKIFPFCFVKFQAIFLIPFKAFAQGVKR